MKPINVAVVLGVAAALTSLPSQARDGAKVRHRNASGMQVVSVDPSAGQPGHGWRYFVDARKARAVVISPGGDYYYSRGRGLALVYKAPQTA